MLFGSSFPKFHSRTTNVGYMVHTMAVRLSIPPISYIFSRHSKSTTQSLLSKMCNMPGYIPCLHI